MKLERLKQMCEVAISELYEHLCLEDQKNFRTKYFSDFTYEECLEMDIVDELEDDDLTDDDEYEDLDEVEIKIIK